MSRKWDQSGRELIGEIKETLRMLFKGVQVYSAEFCFEATKTNTIEPLTPKTFGGVLLQDDAELRDVDFEFLTWSHTVDIDFDVLAQGSHTLVEDPLVMRIPTFMEYPPSVDVISLIAGTCTNNSWPVEPLPKTSPQGIPSKTIRLASKMQAQHIPLSKISSPKLFNTTTGLKTSPVRMSVNTNPLPILRKPIPPHRFSKEDRALFRELLAQKAKIPQADVQIIGVYDRIYLGLYRSLSQTEDGSLLCLPKALSDPTIQNKTFPAMYLILGKSLKNPNTHIQAVLQMEDLRRDIKT